MSLMFCVGTTRVAMSLRATDISACNPHSSFPTATVLPVPSVPFRRR